MLKRTLFLLLFAPVLVFSQKIQNLRATAEGEKIIITYDLTGGVAGDHYNISVFSSSNSFSAPLNRVSGDVGKGINEGTGKRIEWESKAELRNFKGQLSFEIQIEVIAAFALQTRTTSFRRGKTQSLQWRGGDSNQNVKLELLKAGVIEFTMGTVANKGNFEWTIPSSQKTGNDYQLRLTNGLETIKSEPLSIKHKIPTLVKVLPIVAVVAGAVALGGGSKKTTGRTPASDLPPPPNILN